MTLRLSYQGKNTTIARGAACSTRIQDIKFKIKIELIKVHEVAGTRVCKSLTDGGTHALDHFCDSSDLMVSGIGERLHDGWSCSCLARHRHRSLGGPACSGKKSVVAMGTIA